MKRLREAGAEGVGAGTYLVLALLLVVASATSLLISRINEGSRRDAEQVWQLETIRRLTAEQRLLEREAALSGQAPKEVLDQFASIRDQIEASFARLDELSGAARDRTSSALRARDYQHVLEQQLSLIADGYLSSAQAFNDTRVQVLGEQLTEVLAAEQGLHQARAERGARRGQLAVVVTVFVAAALVGGALLLQRRAQRSALASRNAAARRLEALGRHASDLVAVVDRHGQIAELVAAAGLLGDRPRHQLLGTPVAQLVHAEDRAALRSALEIAGVGGVGVAMIRVGDDAHGWRQLALTVSDATDEAGGFVLNGHDVTELRRLEEQLRHQATHDALTGLANRLRLEEQASHALEHDAAGGALLLLDLDDFKQVNDTLGHAAGDELLVAVADRLRTAAPATATPARLGGDEFAVLFRAGGDEEAARTGQRVLEALNRPLMLGEHQVAVSCSIGVATTREADDIGGLLRQADAAMYEAKRAGKNRIRAFEPGMLTAVSRRMDLLTELRDALEHDQMVLHYQPVADLTTHERTHVEALVRWQHPQRGLLPPSEFIPAAESSGLILPIGRWVLRTACEAAASWHRGPGSATAPGICMNVSLSELAETSFRDDVVDVLAATGLDPDLLTLEVTEQVLAADPDEVLPRLTDLAALGVRLAVDDFGTGSSSLQHLRRYPFHVVKIAKTFVDAVREGPEGTAFLHAIVGLAHTAGLVTVAEGVDDAEHYHAVQQLGCSMAQGFHVAAPMPLDALEALLELQPWPTAAGARPRSAV